MHFVHDPRALLQPQVLAPRRACSRQFTLQASWRVAADHGCPALRLSTAHDIHCSKKAGGSEQRMASQSERLRRLEAAAVSGKTQQTAAPVHSSSSRAVVIGGSITGILAAAVTAPYIDGVMPLCFSRMPATASLCLQSAWHCLRPHQTSSFCLRADFHSGNCDPHPTPVPTSAA